MVKKMPEPTLRPFRAAPSRGSLLGAGLLLLALAGPAAAQQVDPDWPCMQRKVAHLAVAQIWSGPALPEDADAWRDDRELARLVHLISARRTDLEDVRPVLASLGPTGEQSRDERLVALFAGVFASIDRERSRIMAGIERYAKKQQELSHHIDESEDVIREAEDAAADGDEEAEARIAELKNRLAWDIRVFQDRRHMLSAVCDSPKILDRRAFDAARLIQGELGE